MHMLKPWSEAQGGLRCLNVDASAAKAPDGSLVATFTADLPKKPEEILGSPFNIIYAIGPLAPDGGLLPHPAAGRPYGGTPLQLRQAGQAGAPQAAPGAEVATPPAPAGAGGPTGAPPAVASTAPAPERDRAVTNSGCQLSLNGRQLGFSACTRLDGIGSDTTLMWALQPLGELAEDTARWGLSHTAHLDTSGPRACRLQCFARGGLGAGIHCSLTHCSFPGSCTAAGNGSSELTLGLHAAAGGWVAVGFPASPGRMLGATAMVLRTCPTCPSGEAGRAAACAS